jgi:DNA replication protein DnaC
MTQKVKFKPLESAEGLSLTTATIPKHKAEQETSAASLGTVDREFVIVQLNAMRAKGQSLALIQRNFQLSRNMSISSTTLSNIINNKDLDKISVEMWRRLHDFCSVRVSNRDWTILDNIDMQRVLTTCSNAYAEKNMKMVVGPTGTGKTTSLKLYANRNAGHTFYCLLTPSMSQKAVLRTIGAVLNIRTLDTTVEHLIKQISDKLNKGCLLILDDVGKVIQRVYAILQEIYDRSEGNCGIVLAGVPSLKKHILEFADRGKESYPELLRRITYMQELDGPTDEIVHRICSDHGIIDTRSINYIRRNCKNFGDLRNWIMAVRRTELTEITVEVLTRLQVGTIRD